ncbi:MAG: DNA polymerase I [Candidatus Peregrinibacteria bacterium Greene0416_19]|nr:MAG: DNA polymerase I [Candidatus Peregrinibacteria bacterium Greene0416_19]
MQQHLVLIDAHHLMYRAYYAIPRTLQTSKGEQTNAVYGVVSMLLAILRTEQPTNLLFCFDAGEETFRHQENATYKDGRAETPDDFYLQIPRVMELIEALDVSHVSDLRYEADDFLCTYARVAEAAGMRVTIVTGDRDALQLADERIRVAIPHKGYQQPEYLGPVEIEAKYGVRPDQIPSYKGLTGDSSDNLPGVRGIGPKTAADLLQRYGSLAGVYEHLDDIKGSVRAKLTKDREQAFFCERMATLVCDIPLPEPLEDTVLVAMPVEPAVRFLRQMEFLSLVKRFESIVASDYGRAHFLQPVAVLAPASIGERDDQLTLF